ncbi:peptidoglycan DD-metalloendopeptidase family protein [Leptobacterium sp. I13]|uniref:peptidoglycan DD-metalloendopeptidase family protein n=1 Tax=Leptobacterium meishanense TaxID=3128904 RepID=UPI0030EE103B
MKKNLFLIILSISVLASCKREKQKNIVHEVDAGEPKEYIEFGYNFNEYLVQRDTVRFGDSFGEILLNHGLGYGEIAAITTTVKDTFDARRIRAGKPYTILKAKDTTQKAQVFIYQHDNINYTVVDFKDSLIQAYNKKKPVKIIEREASGIVKTTLSEAIIEQGIDYNVLNEMSNIYAWTVDFFRLQVGDKFKIIYDEKYIEDTIYSGAGRIKAAYFEHNGKPFYAFRYESDTIKKIHDYYDEEGNTMRRAFLRAPLNFSRISSRFSPRRFHPVQKRWKAHKGTDYAAPRGTPIMATANGTVTKSGYTKGNGNYVKIRHNSTYETQYLHMTKRAVKVGEFVEQGDVIGYVGSTGLATGPHVCYRFWKNGYQVDPYKQDLPAAEPMDESIKEAYLSDIHPLITQLDCILFDEEYEELVTELN